MPCLLRLPLTLLIAFLASVAATAATPQAAVALAWRDSLTIPAGLRETTRYFYVGDWLPAADKKRLWQSLSSQCNRLSREALIVPPPLVLADGTVRLWPAVAEQDWAQLALVRINLVDYRWDPRVFDRLGFRNILFNTVLTETVEETTVTTFATDGRTVYRRWPGEEWVLDSAWKGARTRKTTRKLVALAPSIAETAEQRAALIGLLTALTSSKGVIPTTPVVDGEYFLWETSIQVNRNVGYYGLSGINNQRDFERAIGYDPRADVDPAFLYETLDAISGKKSGVAIHNRRISRRQGFRPYYLTGDNAQALAENNPLRFVDGGFRDNAREAFGMLPNYLWTVGLFVGNQPLVAGTKEGDRQDSAPDFVGFFHQSQDNDGRIHAGFTCFKCHINGGLQDSNGWFRPMLKSAKFLNTVDPKQLKTLQAYAGPLNQLIAQDRLTYESALKLCNGLTSQQDSNQWTDWYYQYEAGVTIERVARDTGLPLAEFKARFEKHYVATKFADNLLGTWILPDADRAEQGPMSLDDYVDSANLIALTIRGLNQWPIEIRQAIVVKPGK